MIANKSQKKEGVFTMGEVLEAISYVDEIDTLLHDVIDEPSERPSFPKLDGIVFPIVVANADVIAPCPWMAGAEVTLTEALNNYYRPMTEENADTVLAEVIEFITNRVEAQEEVMQEVEPTVEDKETETTTRAESQSLQNRDTPPAPVSATDVQKVVVAKSTKLAPVVTQDSESNSTVDITAEYAVDNSDHATTSSDQEVEIVKEPQPLRTRPSKVVNEDPFEALLKERVTDAVEPVDDDLEVIQPSIDAPTVERDVEPRGEMIVETQPDIQNEFEEVILLIDRSPREVAVNKSEAKLDSSEDMPVQQSEAISEFPVVEDAEPEYIETEVVAAEQVITTFEYPAQLNVNEDQAAIEEIAFEDEERIYSLQPELDGPTSVDAEAPIFEEQVMQDVELLELSDLPTCDTEPLDEPNLYDDYQNVSIEAIVVTFKNEEDEEQPVVTKTSSKTFRSNASAIKKPFVRCVSMGKSVLKLYAAGPSGQYEPIIYKGYVMT